MKGLGTPADALRKPAQRWFAVLFGAFLGLTLLKFGNPPIFEEFVTAPGNLLEFALFFPWPIRWAYCALAVLCLLALLSAERTRPDRLWISLLPVGWLLWQVLAATQSIDPGLSWPAVSHFTACCACFYIGLFCLRAPESRAALLVGLFAGFLLVLATGFEQHFGGLDESRKYFYTYTYPQLKHPPPEYLKRLTSTRIFGTLFYPNALAGVILLLFPVFLCMIAQARERFTPGARGLLLVILAGASLACLVWSGSKGGWLLMLFLGLLALLRLQFDRRLKLLLVGILLLFGLAGFGIRYATYLKKGGTSIVARFDYWRAALKISAAHPLFGTGPATFSKPYAAIKKPESEMARLTHNDYLEQACDSGWPGFLVFSAFVAGAMVSTYPKSIGQGRSNGAGSCDPLSDKHRFAIWLGLLGWALQSFVEFGLYIPALAWTSFTLLGMLLGEKARRIQNAR